MQTWEELLESCSSCTQCELAKKRKNVVIGRGNKDAPVMLIGEGPGEQEDIIGEPFVGAAGKLLDLLLDALMFDPKDYYIANIVKCRPPDNRVPTDEEADKCLQYLRMQMKLVRPRIIVCLGATAAKYIVDRNAKISNIRGKWLENKGFYIMPTFHPAALLRDASKKALMFKDMKMVRDMLTNSRSGG
ncbi:MAG: uracil-DNA glycosylase [Eubacteriales bacterium]|nr:uracil-DNA glycosylase [Eubacteriales bacterium]